MAQACQQLVLRESLCQITAECSVNEEIHQD